MSNFFYFQVIADSICFINRQKSKVLIYVVIADRRGKVIPLHFQVTFNHGHILIIDFRAEYLHQRLSVRSETKCTKHWRRQAFFWYARGGSTLWGKRFASFSKKKNIYIIIIKFTTSLHFVNQKLLFCTNKVSLLSKQRCWWKYCWGWRTQTWMSSIMTWWPKCSRWDCTISCCTVIVLVLSSQRLCFACHNVSIAAHFR